MEIWDLITLNYPLIIILIQTFPTIYSIPTATMYFQLCKPGYSIENMEIFDLITLNYPQLPPNYYFDTKFPNNNVVSLLIQCIFNCANQVILLKIQRYWT